jgi:hypothetical protein
VKGALSTPVERPQAYDTNPFLSDIIAVVGDTIAVANFCLIAL